ncbi:MAG: hypothetical protein WC539_09080 [Nitrospirota bacterium]
METESHSNTGIVYLFNGHCYTLYPVKKNLIRTLSVLSPSFKQRILMMPLSCMYPKKTEYLPLEGGKPTS